MKKFITLLLLIIPVICSAKTENDTLTWKGNIQIIVNSDSDGINLQVLDKSADYTKVYETQYKNGTSSTRWEISEHVNIPFSNLIVGKKKKRLNTSFETHWAGFGFGFVNACNDGMKFINSNDPNGVAINFSNSYELSLNMIDVGVPIIGNNFGLVMGFGINWRNYVLQGNRILNYNNHKVEIETLSDESDVKKSRIKRFDLVVPIMLEWNLGRDFYVMAGTHVNFTTRTSIKNVYNYSETNFNLYKKGIESNPIGVDLVARVGYDCLGFYAKYSPTKIFQSNQGPDMRSFSTGMILSF